MSRLLLTGFEPYGKSPINPAEQVAEALDGKEIAGAQVISRIVPNSFYRCIEVVVAAIEELQPEAVLMMGEYGGRSMLTLERLAQNLNDGTRYGILDNAGRTLQGEMTVPGGPAAYYTTVPLRAMITDMRAAGVPCDISDSGATFCCNHLFYGILHHVETEGLAIRVGWIHLPFLPEVAARVENLGAPSMSCETASLGVATAIASMQTHPQDSDTAVMSRMLV
ncbi:MAG: pyroglutamyl-peptidase I [Rhodospirillales bacterium]